MTEKLSDVIAQRDAMRQALAALWFTPDQQCNHEAIMQAMADARLVQDRKLPGRDLAYKRLTALGQAALDMTEGR